MTKTEMKPVICKDCAISVGTPVQVSLKNPEINGIARAAMYRYGFVGGFIHGYTSRKKQTIRV